MAEKKNNRADKFQWGDGDLVMVFNPNDKKKKPTDKKPDKKNTTKK